MTPEQLRELVLYLHPPLTRAAFLLDPGRAEDLDQDVLVKVVADAGKVLRADDPVAYARRMLVNTFLSGRRRKASTEVVTAAPPDRALGFDETGAVLDRQELRRALAALPERQRLAVVLRHVEDLSEQMTADLLGCAPGTVKSLTSRGLAGLRTRLTEGTAP